MSTSQSTSNVTIGVALPTFVFVRIVEAQPSFYEAIDQDGRFWNLGPVFNKEQDRWVHDNRWRLVDVPEFVSG